jgi:hypothetical protein
LRSGFQKIKKAKFSARFIPDILVLAVYSGIFLARIFTSPTIRYFFIFIKKNPNKIDKCRIQGPAAVHRNHLLLALDYRGCGLQVRGGLRYLQKKHLSKLGTEKKGAVAGDE